jgi:hypothetical protein
LLAEFSFSGGSTLRTNSTQWQYYLTSILNQGELGEAPTADALEAELLASIWTAPGFSTPNGANPWAGFSSNMPVPAISTDAQWISRSASDDASFYLTVYRSIPVGTIESASVPEPTSLAIFCLGLFAISYQHRIRSH